jgi:succinoglycan biosynthesis protein ExoO
MHGSRSETEQIAFAFTASSMNRVRSNIPGGLTIVMPLFNKGAHVERAVQSVLDQAGGFDALVIVDDGSTDDGPERVRRINDDRITLLHRSPPGPGGYLARNLGIRHASTEWIAFLDADDTWQPDFTQAMSALIARFGDSASCAFTSYNIKNQDGAIRQQPLGAAHSGRDPMLLSCEDYLEHWLRHGDAPMWTGAIAIRRQTLLDAGLFPEGRCRRGGDKDLWLRVLNLTPAVFDPQPRATYHRDSDNMVTRNVKPDSQHCVVQTIAGLRKQSSARCRALLESVSNLETFNYSLIAATSATLNPSIYEVFYRRAMDLRFYAIALLVCTPSRIRPKVAYAFQRIHGYFSKA